MGRSVVGRRSCWISLVALAALGGCTTEEVVDGRSEAVQSVDPATLTPPPPPFLDDLRCQKTGPRVRCTAEAAGPLFGFIADCGLFPVFVDGTDEARVTLEYGADRRLISVTEHHTQDGVVSNPMGGTVTGSFSASFKVSADVVDITPFGVVFGPVTYVGQVVKVVVPGSGQVLHDVGKIVLGAGVLFEGGPHDLFHGNTGALCAALCADPFEVCGGGCRALEWDSAHCGACGNACAVGQSCQLGTCVDNPCADDGACNQMCGFGDPDCFEQCLVPDGVCEPMCGPADPDCQACFNPMPDGSCLPGCEVFGSDPDCPCPPGSDHCGQPFCTPLGFDPNNCGACGNVCGPAQTCGGGQCIDCVSGDGLCAPGCQQAGDSDCPCATNGVCDPMCGPMDVDCQACINPMPDGTCAPGCEAFNSDPDCPCAPGTVRCTPDGVCTDVQFDPAHCGACGNVCATGEQCHGGTCIVGPSCAPDMLCDPSCPPGMDPDCGPPIPCMVDEHCPAGFRCDPMQFVCLPG